MNDGVKKPTESAPGLPRAGWLFLLGLLVGAPALQASDEAYLKLPRAEHVETPAWFKASFLDLREDLAEAKAAGKRLVIYFHQEGCPYCAKLLGENFAPGPIADTMQARYDVVTVNIWGAQDLTTPDGRALSEKAWAQSLRVQFTPTLLFLDGDGREELRLNGYYPPKRFRLALDYLHERPAGTSLRDYIAQREPEPAQGELNADASYLKPPHDLSSRGRAKPLLVLFEQRTCRACDELHRTIFKLPETRRLLERFDIVQLDQWADTEVVTPAGVRTTAARWARELQVSYAPTLVLYAGDGREVLRLDAYYKALHVQSALDYVAAGAWQAEPSFQLYLSERTARLRQGAPAR